MFLVLHRIYDKQFKNQLKIMITDKEFYGMVDRRISEANRCHLEAGFSGIVESFRDYVQVTFLTIETDGHLSLGNLTPSRAEFMGFERLDNGVWLFPHWYAPMLVDGGIYVHIDGDDWIYERGDEHICLHLDGEHLTFGVRFDDEGLVIA